jgi:hypothetical protein
MVRGRRDDSQIVSGSEGRGELASRRFSCRQACESALLNTVRYRHHHRLLVVDALGPCDGACYCLEVSRSKLTQSTFVCPSVVDAPPCSPTVLSRGWWSVDVDTGVSVQHTAATSGVASMSWCCSCLDESRSSLPQSTSVCPLVVDGRSSVTSACTPDGSCALLVD